MGALDRDPQLRGTYTPGDPATGYYNDLTSVARGYGSPYEARAWLDLFANRRDRIWPVSVLQLGLGAWQLAQAGESDWLDVAAAVAEWAVLDMDGYGRFAHHQDMPHTYAISAPWHSAMAQGQGASLLVRMARSLDRPELLGDARRSVRSLHDDDAGLIARTPDGAVLQEYPTNPAAHVLNGWIWALWGLYDTAVATGDAELRSMFEDGVDTLATRLPQYETGRGWSRYDLYPHPVVNIASPFYHRLHVEQLRAMNDLAPREALAEHADRWEAALGSRTARAAAVARKVGFRIARPRSKRVA